MNYSLDIHPASEAERRAAYRNVFDVWPKAATVEEHVERRLQSPQHNRAAWYVGCLAGRVVASLACYPLAFHLDGELVDGLAFGSVHTLAEWRGQGFAPRLIRWVEEQRARQGARLSLLYSDINPDYYARQGYLLCPAWHGWADVSATGDDGEADNDWQLTPCDSGVSSNALRRCHAADHGRSALAVARSPEYWEHTLEKFPHDEYFWLTSSAGDPLGYVRARLIAETLKITDYALSDADLAERLYRGVLRLARQRGVPRAGGWLPATPVTRKLFQLEPRPKEITMLKPLDDRLRIDVAHRQAADRFCEVDHV